MAETTGINWVDSTFNAWIGCTRVDEACRNCYAEAQNSYRRWNGGTWGPGAPRKVMSDHYWKQPHTWNRKAIKAGVRQRVFCSSLADVFDDESPAGQRERLFETIRATPALDWLLLTKRAHRIAERLPKDWGQGWENVWLGVTVGDAKGQSRIAHLRPIPAAVHFISVEPLIEAVDVSALFAPGDAAARRWVIVGGESGHHCRPMNPAWARAVLSQTRAGGGAFWMKQLGGNPDPRHNIELFPADLRVREHPRSRKLALGLVVDEDLAGEELPAQRKLLPVIG